MRLVNLAEYESRARDIEAGSTLDYYDGGSNDEITLRENVAAFSRITLYPRVFRGVGQRELHTTILGLPTSTPVIVAPVALIGMLHRDGEVPVVRAASNAGSIVTLSTFSVTPIEDVVAAAAGPVWFQLYVYKDRSASEALVRRVEAAGCAALELTADAPILGQRVVPETRPDLRFYATSERGVERHRLIVVADIGRVDLQRRKQCVVLPRSDVSSVRARSNGIGHRSCATSDRPNASAAESSSPCAARTRPRQRAETARLQGIAERAARSSNRPVHAVTRRRRTGFRLLRDSAAQLIGWKSWSTTYRPTLRPSAEP